MRVYHRYENKEVMYNLLFVKASDSYVYEDAACTEKVEKEALQKAFIEGLYLCTSSSGVATDKLQTVVECDISNGAAAVKVVDTVSSAVAFVTYYSKEHTA